MQLLAGFAVASAGVQEEESNTELAGKSISPVQPRSGKAEDDRTMRGLALLCQYCPYRLAVYNVHMRISTKQYIVFLVSADTVTNSEPMPLSMHKYYASR